MIDVLLSLPRGLYGLELRRLEDLGYLTRFAIFPFLSHRSLQRIGNLHNFASPLDFVNLATIPTEQSGVFQKTGASKD